MPVEKHLKLSPRYTCTRVRTCDLVLPVIRVLKHQRPVNPRGWGTFQGWYLWAGVLWCPVGYCLSASPNQTLSSPLWSREFEAYITAIARQRAPQTSQTRLRLIDVPKPRWDFARRIRSTIWSVGYNGSLSCCQDCKDPSVEWRKSCHGANWNHELTSCYSAPETRYTVEQQEPSDPKDVCYTMKSNS